MSRQHPLCTQRWVMQLTHRRSVRRITMLKWRWQSLTRNYFRVWSCLVAILERVEDVNGNAPSMRNSLSISRNKRLIILFVLGRRNRWNLASLQVWKRFVPIAISRSPYLLTSVGPWKRRRSRTRNMIRRTLRDLTPWGCLIRRRLLISVGRRMIPLIKPVTLHVITFMCIILCLLIRVCRKDPPAILRLAFCSWVNRRRRRSVRRLMMKVVVRRKRPRSLRLIVLCRPSCRRTLLIISVMTLLVILMRRRLRVMIILLRRRRDRVLRRD